MNEDGSYTVEALLVLGIITLTVLLVANLGVWAYAKGVGHSAVDQGVRVGSRVDVDTVAVCEERVRRVLGSLLDGPMGDGAEVSCATDGELVTARVHLVLPAWLPPMTDSSYTAVGLARKERAP